MFVSGQPLPQRTQIFRPEIYQSCHLLNARADLDFMRVDAHAFKRCPSSPDYAVMENTSDSAVRCGLE